MKNKFGLGNAVVIGMTVIVFVIALFLKGFTHDLLIEVGVLLVSVKLIMMNYKMSLTNQELLTKMDELKKVVEEFESNNKQPHSNKT